MPERKKTIPPNNVAYCFDWDDNIIKMPTKIVLEKLIDDEWKIVELSTEEYASIRGDKKYRYVDNDIYESMHQFRDDRDATKFIKDLEKALQNPENIRYSFSALRQCILNKSPFAIISARGHSPKVIKSGIKFLIETVFSDEERKLVGDVDEYLDMQKYYPVTSDKINSKLSQTLGVDTTTMSVEEKKFLTFKHFIEFLRSTRDGLITVGFSDDDRENINTMMRAVAELIQNNESYNDIWVTIFDTSTHGNVELHKIKP